MPKLIVTTQGIPQTYELLADITTLGRGDHSMIQVRDNKSSRDHAQVLRASGTYWVIDRGSHNGTRVNGEKITRRGLKNGDVITIGLVTCVFIDDSAPAPATAPAAAPSPARAAEPAKPAPAAAPAAAPAPVAAAPAAPAPAKEPEKSEKKEPAAKEPEKKDGFQNLDQEVFDRIRGIFGSGATPSKALRAAREGGSDSTPASSETDEKKKGKKAKGKKRK